MRPPPAAARLAAGAVPRPGVPPSPRTTRSPLLCQRCTLRAASGPRLPASACRWGCQTRASTWSRAGASGRSRAPLRAAAAVQMRLQGMLARLGAWAGAQGPGPPLMGWSMRAALAAGPRQPLPAAHSPSCCGCCAAGSSPAMAAAATAAAGRVLWRGGWAGGVAGSRRQIEQCTQRSGGRDEGAGLHAARQPNARSLPRPCPLHCPLARDSVTCDAGRVDGPQRGL